MTPTLWLSVIEMCNRSDEQHPKLKAIGVLARAKFNELFDHDLLRTDLTKKDHEPASGRKIKK